MSDGKALRSIEVYQWGLHPRLEKCCILYYHFENISWHILTLTNFFHIWLKLLDDAGLEAILGGAEMTVKEPPPISAPEEKKPSLSLEELEAKQGNRFRNINSSATLSSIPLCMQLLISIKREKNKTDRRYINLVKLRVVCPCWNI